MAIADRGTWFGQPKGLTILFLTEMWEKFSFFGMRALQIYYMVKQLHMEQGQASLIFGAYAAGVYLTPIAGAVVSDRWLGKQRAIVIGALTMAAGHFLMAFESTFYLAMVTIAIGNGLFLPNLPSQVGDLYERGDPKRESAFSIYYVGVNLGAFLAPLVCGTIGETYGWHYGFAAAGIGMCLGLAIYLGGRRHLPQCDQAPRRGLAPRADAQRSRPPVGLMVAIAAAVVLFRASYEQTGNTMALWIDQGVNRDALGFQIPATWFQSLNPLLVFLLTPLVVARWNRKPAIASEAGALRRMSLGAWGTGIAFLMLATLCAQVGGDTPGAVPWPWVLAFFVLQTAAELYILPVGLGLFARLAPVGFGATAIAAWFLASFAGNLLSGVVGMWWSVMPASAFFLAMAGITGVSGTLLFAIGRWHQARRASALAGRLPQGDAAPVDGAGHDGPVRCS